MTNNKEEIIMETPEDEYVIYPWNEIARVLVDEPDISKIVKMTPSAYIKHMTMSLEERYRQVTNPVRQCTFLKPTTWTPPKQTDCLSAEPNILLIQGWNTDHKYHFNIKITNTCKSMVFMKLVYPDRKNHQCFKIKLCSRTGTRLAPGLSSTILVYFEAPDQRDYFGLIKVLTKSEDIGILCIPLIALAPRAMLDLPDCVYLPEAPVKSEVFKTLLVRNISPAGTHFNFHVPKPFRVEPEDGIINGKEIIQLNIYFRSPSIGNFERELTINYASGEILIMKCFGSAFEAPIHLTRKSILIDDTYFSLNRFKTFELINNSDHIISFSWKKYPTLSKDNEILKNLEEGYKEIRDLESCKSTLQEYVNLVSDQEVHKKIYGRIYDDEVSQLYRENFFFHDKHFTITPQYGEAWPHSNLEFHVIFTPDSSNVFTADAYLEVTGLQNRLPLEIKAKGIGPKIKLNVETLDIDYIFLCSIHYYEIIATNEGDIPGMIRFVEKELKFGGRVNCFPTSQALNPGQYKTFTIGFSSNQQGSFIEEICFIIKGSKEKVILMLKGKIVSPTLHFSVKYVDFGKVPIGFHVKQKFDLENLSLVPVAFALRVLHDGDDNAITYSSFEREDIKPRLPRNPREFHIKPKEGIVEAHSKLEVQLKLTPNVVRNWKTSLMVDMWDSKSESVSLEIRYHSEYPKIVCQPNELIIRFCFLNYPYNRVITLQNISDVPGFFYLVPQDFESSPGMSYYAQITQGIIDVNEKKQIPLSIMAHKLGRQNLDLKLLILGQVKPFSCCMLGCNGQGAVISLTPTELIWGSTPILKEKPLYLRLTNDSPIPALFKMILPYSSSPWTVYPVEGVIKPEEVLEVVVTIFLRDAGRYRETLIIEVKDSRVMKVDLYAIGVGSSIIVEPKIAPIYNFGQIFSEQVFRIPFVITNRGTRTHQLLWTTNKDVKNFSRAIVDTMPENTFQVMPNKILLGSEESINFFIEGIYNRVGTVSEEIFLHGLIENRSRHLIFSAVLTAEFIMPKLAPSREEVVCRCDVTPGRKLEFLRATVGLSNLSNLPLEFELQVDFPFGFINGRGHYQGQVLERELAGMKGTLVHLHMDPMFKFNRYSRIARGTIKIKFKDHPHRESIPITGEVNFPNVLLTPNDKVDFKTVPLGKQIQKYVTITNSSPLKTRFFWFLAADTVDIQYFEKQNISMIEWPINFMDEANHEEEEIISLNNDNKKKIIQKKLHPIYEPFFEPEINSFLYEILPSKAPLVKDIIRIFDIVPFYGTLEPLECQRIHFTFNAFTHLKASVKAFCIVEGGPSESLYIHGIAAELGYSISETIIDYGRVIFSDFCQRTFTIQNTHILGFNFLFTREDKKPILSKITQKSSILDFFQNNHMFKAHGLLQIDTPKGFLNGNQSLDIQLRYLPALIGPFDLKIFLEIGHLEPITLEIRGFAGFPQAYLHLPRPAVHEINVTTQYKSVVSLEIYCELGLNEEAQRMERLSKNVTAGEDFIDFINSPHLDFDHFLDEVDTLVLPNPEEWVVINYNDPRNHFPLVLELELSLERELLINHIRNNPYIFSTIVKSRTIPKFFVPPYVIDLGFVITDMPTTFTTIGYNYGPTPIHMSLNESHGNLEKNNITLHHNNLSVIAPGGSFTIMVSFNPTLEKFPEIQHNIEDIFLLEVWSGAKIPIHITAIVTRPYILLQEQSVNFGKVKCGQCSIQVIRMINDGLIPCTWLPTLPSRIYRKRLPAIVVTCLKELNKNISIVSVDDSPFTVRSQQTTYQPGECGYIEILYKPLRSISVDTSELVISIENNREKIRIPIYGEAIEPFLHISATKIDFGSILPYSRNKYRIFDIKNPWPIPVEIFFPQYDKQFKKETEVLNLLFRYYNTQELLIPIRNPGEKFPIEILDFYNTAKNAFRSKILDNNDEDIKSPKQKENLSPASSPKNFIQDPLSNFSESKMYSLLLNFLDDENNKKYFKNANPIEDAMQARIRELHPVVNTEPIPGAVMIFNGAPFTDSIELAWKTARSLNMIALNVDDVLKDALSKPNSLSSLKAYDMLVSSYKSLLNKIDVNDISEKIDYILNEIKSSPLKSIKRTRTNLANIPLNLFENILHQRLTNNDCGSGVIFDSLMSIFIPDITDVLKVILTVAGNIKFAHCVSFYNTLADYREWKNEEIKNRERIRILEMKAKLKILKNLSESDIQELSPEDNNLFEKYILNNRRIQKNKESKADIHKAESRRSRRRIGSRGFKLRRPSTPNLNELNDEILKLNNQIKDEFNQFETSFSTVAKILEKWNLSNTYQEAKIKKELPKRKKNETPKSAKSKTSEVENEKPEFLGVPHWIIDCRKHDAKRMEYIIDKLCNQEEIFHSLRNL